jgi:preprotein translocase subunit YajC
MEMMEQVDLKIVIAVVLVLLAIWFFIRRQNRKDKHDLEEEVIKTDLKVDKHDDPHV